MKVQSFFCCCFHCCARCNRHRTRHCNILKRQGLDLGMVFWKGVRGGHGHVGNEQ